MLRMNKKFFGLALVATLFVGCQTAQKVTDANTADEDLYFPGYGSDRTPSSVEPLVALVFKELRVIGERVGAKAVEKAASKEFRTFANRFVKTAADPSIKGFDKSAKDFQEMIRAERRQIPGTNADRINAPFTEEELARLPNEFQEKIYTKFIAKQTSEAFPSLTAFQENIQKQYGAFGASDMRQVKGKTVLRENEIAKGSNSDFFVKAEGKLSTKESQSYQVLIKSLDTLVDNEVTEAGKAEVRVLVKKARLAAGRIYRLSGLSHLMPETCQNLDRASLKEYVTLLEDIEKELKTYPIDKATGRVKCVNVAEITVYVAAKFQERLGRLGLSALVAVQEMKVCGYLSPETEPVARQVASEGGGKVPERPACK